MSEEEKILFEENQYHGLNRHSLVRRTLLSVFCFVAYFWSENPKPVEVGNLRIGEYPGDVKYGELFFVLGLAVLVLSVILLFVRHMKTQLTFREIIIHGQIGPRLVHLRRAEIHNFRKVTIRPSIFNRPVFNLQTKGRTRFYTWGNEMIEITLNNWNVYRIGTQRATELLNLLKTE